MARRRQQHLQGRVDLPLEGGEAFTESSPYRPRTPYNASKAGADHAVRAYHETYGLPVTITNCANNYGPWQFPEKVLPLFIANGLDGRPLPMYASSENRREWIHVYDHCRAVAAVLERGRTGETYHVGTGVERSVEQLADAVHSVVELGQERVEHHAVLLVGVGQRVAHPVGRRHAGQPQLAQVPRQGALRDVPAPLPQQPPQLLLAPDRLPRDDLPDGLLALALVRHAAEDTRRGRGRQGPRVVARLLGGATA